jgi:uncharacterized sulfatase
MTGVNQLDTWRGGEAARDWSVTENRHTLKNVHLRTLVTERYKMTVYRSYEFGELFDLVEDPDERNNLWDDPEAAEVKASLMKRFMQVTMSYEPTPMPRIAGA